MKKIYSFPLIWLLLSVLFFWVFKIFAADEAELSWYDLYLDRNKTICSEYDPEKKIFSAENDYEDLGHNTNDSWNKISDNSSVSWNDLEIAKKQYKDTMNSIYKCALLSAQERSIWFITDTLGQDSWNYVKQFKAEEKRIEIARDNHWCANIGNNNTKVNDQKNVIDQTTFELCKYNNYLEYLLEYNSVIANVLEQDKKSAENWESNFYSPDQISQTYNLTDIANIERAKKIAINEEIERAYNIYPIAFQAYSEYEDNLPVHDLLTMLRNDFIDLRLNLHKTLNPINQVVYKISNAMKE